MEKLLLRAGYGNGIIDSVFREKALQYEKQGIEFEVYWLSYAYSCELAEKEAIQYVETVEEFYIQEPLYVIFTYDSVRYAESKGIDVSESRVIQWMNAFCCMAQKMGRKVESYIDLEKYEKDIFIKIPLPSAIYGNKKIRYTGNDT